MSNLPEPEPGFPNYQPGQTPAGSPSEGQPANGLQDMSDLVIGVNARLWDNIFQGLFTAACTLVGAAVGWFILEPQALPGAWLFPVLIGAFFGMIVGLFISGMALMIYRFLVVVRRK